jgi:hypothetical protein
MLNGRVKGQIGEREACRLLGDVIGELELTRNLEQVRSGGADILGISGLCIEVKRQETLSINSWWQQVCRAADNRGDVPVLMFRQNRKPWRFLLPAYLLTVGAPGYIELQEPAFRCWLRAWVR